MAGADINALPAWDLTRGAGALVAILDSGVDYNRADQIFHEWAEGVAQLATCDNIVAKLGGLAMPDNGFGWHTAERPPTSDEFIEAQSRYYLHTIERFGPERCMFESNFPVDRFSLSYRTVWNAFKKLIADFTAAERDAMLRGTAARVYRLS